MGLASLSSNHKFLWAALLISALSGGLAFAKNTHVCPLRMDDPVTSIDVFDGSPDEQAFLAPDREVNNVDTFSLGYVYQDGRTVTIRCKYGSGFVADVALRSRVNSCIATVGAGEAISVNCQ